MYLYKCGAKVSKEDLKDNMVIHLYDILEEAKGEEEPQTDLCLQVGSV